MNAATDSWEQTVESFLYLADLREALTCWTLCCTLRLRIGLQRQQSEHEATLMLAVQAAIVPHCGAAGTAAFGFKAAATSLIFRLFSLVSLAKIRSLRARSYSLTEAILIWEF